MSKYDDGYRKGWTDAIAFSTTHPGIWAEGQQKVVAEKPTTTRKKPRKASAANKKYGRAFKRLAPKYKKKNGGWKKDGFKRCAAAARREAKR